MTRKYTDFLIWSNRIEAICAETEVFRRLVSICFMGSLTILEICVLLKHMKMKLDIMVEANSSAFKTCTMRLSKINNDAITIPNR